MGYCQIEGGTAGIIPQREDWGTAEGTAKIDPHIFLIFLQGGTGGQGYCHKTLTEMKSDSKIIKVVRGNLKILRCFFEKF